MPSIPDVPVPNNMPYPAMSQLPTDEITADGAITPTKPCLYNVSKAGVAALTLAAPTLNGVIIGVFSETAQAHTIDLATTGINGGSADVGTFGGAIGDGVLLISIDSNWYQMANINVTWA